jgi:MFS family permease
MKHPFSAIDKKNFIVNIAEGSIYIAGAAFISGQTVLPALVTRLGGGNVAVGSIAVLLWVGLFLPQVFAARYVETLPWKKPWAIIGGSVQRTFLLMLSVAIFFFGERNPGLALASVIVFYGLNQVGLGVTTPGWFDLFAKVTAVKRRGRLTGIRNSIGGAGAFVCGLALTWMLAKLAFPISYALAFFCAFVLQSISIIVQLNLVEEEPSAVVPRRPLFAYLGQLPGVLRTNTRFRSFLIMSALLVVAVMPVGFFTVYAMRKFGGDEALVGTFTLAMVAVQVVSAIVNGYIADHFGYKLAMSVAAVGMLFASVTAILAPSAGWFILVYAFVGINLGSEVMLRYNMSIEFGPVEQRSTYVGLMNTALAPFYLTSLLGGWLSDAFGYETVFILGALFSIGGILWLVFRVEDPHESHTAQSRLSGAGSHYSDSLT